jgi:hypothetical protein
VAGPDDAIHDLLTEAAVLLELDAARAEAWASGLLADWADHDELVDALASVAPADGDTAGEDRDVALAVAVALEPMLPAARRAADALSAQGAAPPSFAPFVGTARPVGAWTIRDRHSESRSVVVEYEHEDGARHDLLVELDGEVAVDLLVGPAGVVDAARDADERRLVVEPSTPQDALGAIRRGMQRVLDGEVALLTDAYLLNHALVAARVGLPIDRPEIVTGDAEDVDTGSDDPEGDATARTTLTSALGSRRDEPVPHASIAAAAAAWRAAIARGDADAAAVAVDARVDPEADDLDDVRVLVRLAGAYVRRGPRTAMSPSAARAVDALEWADWLGAVLQLVRQGVGADASGEQLVRNVNRCPEVTTSIPKRDAPAVASAFDRALVAWRVSGAVDEDARLTELGAWLLPRALAAAWGASPGEL